MKVVSYNVRGLGGGEKRVEVRKLVLEKKPLVLCLQETKLQEVNDVIINSIWGNSTGDFSYQPSSGASGGLVTVWDASRLEVLSSMSFEHVLIIRGKGY
jgi:hypothetical protein